MTDLNKQQKQSLRKASSSEVETVFHRIPPHLARSRWLSKGNDYVTDCIGKLREHTQPGNAINGNDLSEYIAVSAPLHCFDGWVTLGRALDAVTRDDPNTAVHLSYYAELRAAMSLLAAEGIGIFEDRHFVITTSGVQSIGTLGKKGGSNLKTHKIAWQALEHWASLGRSQEVFKNIIQPSGISLGQWLDAFGAATLSRAIGMKWMKTWGVDLKRLSKGTDRDARNQASYRPTYLAQGAQLDVNECSSFVRRLWQVCEPSQPARFEALDRYLLRRTLRQAYDALPHRISYEDRVASMLNSIFPAGGALTDAWSRFLTGLTDPDDPALISEASRRARRSDSRHHLQVLSRATLLLRVATGVCMRLLRSVPIGRTELEFWWKSLGEQHALWRPGGEPEDLTELWEDVNASVEDLRDWEDRNTGRNTSYTSWREELPRQISILGECERVALWGLGL